MQGRAFLASPREVPTRRPARPEGVVESYRAHPADGGSRAAGDGEPFVVKLLRAGRVQRQAYPRLASRFLAAGRRPLPFSPAHSGRVFDVGEEAAGFSSSRAGGRRGSRRAGPGGLSSKQRLAARGWTPLWSAWLAVRWRGCSRSRTRPSRLFSIWVSVRERPGHARGEVVLRGFRLVCIRARAGRPPHTRSGCSSRRNSWVRGDQPNALAGARLRISILWRSLHFLVGGKPPFEARSLGRACGPHAGACARLVGVTGRSQRGHPRPDRARSEDRPRGRPSVERIAGRPSGPGRGRAAYHQQESRE